MEPKYKKNLSKFLLSLMLSVLIIDTGCKKLIDVDPPTTKITSANAYSSDATAAAVLTGLYIQLSSMSYGNAPTLFTLSMQAGLSADEFSLWSGASVGQMAFYRNALSVNTGGSEFWSNIYPLIYSCNAAIEGLNNSTTLTPTVKQQLLGEAKFMRAFFYFYLVNLYGDIPLVLSTDYTFNARLARSTKANVYEQIITDLKDAQGLLNDGYVKADAFTVYPTASAERVRPNKSSASALLARAYLYSSDYVNAEAQATTLINNTAYYNLVSLNNVFLKNSQEAIWQLQPVFNGTLSNTIEAPFYILSFAPTGVNSTHPVYLSSSLLNSFEVGDQRKINGNWVNIYTDVTGTYYYPYKNKATSTTTVTPTEYRMVLRLGEQYLIRAEARAQQNNISGAQSDLNAIRIRAGLSNTIATTQSGLLTVIFHERQVELFAEMGQRWFDLKRTGSIDAVMSLATPLKGGTWNSYQQLYPISSYDILKDPSLVQNTGY